MALGGGGPPPEEMAFGAGGSETPSLAVGVRSWGGHVERWMMVLHGNSFDDVPPALRELRV